MDRFKNINDASEWLLTAEEYRKMWYDIDKRFEAEAEERQAMKKYEEEYNE